MPVAEFVEEKIEIPDGVKVDIRGEEVIVASKEERISRRLHHPRVSLALEGAKVVVRCDLPRRREKAIVGTFAAHIKNMVKGVTEGFEYHMKVVYSHFPLKVSVKGSDFVIENFLGEKHPRKARILGKTKVNVQGDKVLITGPNIEDVSQTAANIERATRIKGFDPRVFQDGIYIIQKGKES